jgi:hypothetical protein
MPATPRSAAETVASLTLQLHYKTDEYKTVAVGLGRFRDNPAALIAAAEYILAAHERGRAK